MPPSPLAAALADRYRLERELGAGGMAAVARGLVHAPPTPPSARASRYCGPRRECTFRKFVSRSRLGIQQLARFDERDLVLHT